jgi:hypothetical protein
MSTPTEQIMAEHPHVRRLPDGSIDFAFYRRRAARQRRLTKRLVIRSAFALIRSRLEASAIAIGSYRPVLPEFSPYQQRKKFHVLVASSIADWFAGVRRDNREAL